eukprot:449687-Pyramimonas_sp.AAC.1
MSVSSPTRHHKPLHRPPTACCMQCIWRMVAMRADLHSWWGSFDVLHVGQLRLVALRQCLDPAQGKGLREPLRGARISLGRATERSTNHSLRLGEPCLKLGASISMLPSWQKAVGVISDTHPL